jgi:hypothetical protein
MKWAMKITSPRPISFLAIFGGSSVTAGHDNYYNQSYPLVVRNHLTPIFDMLGVDLNVHNIAQGANPCVPYDLCYESMGGFDPDFVNWEQSYNCGHDAGAFELMARLAGYSKNKAIVYYSASGAFLPKCPVSPTQPAHSSDAWNPQMENLTPWKPTRSDIKKEKDSLEEYAAARNSFNRFASSWSNKPAYKGVPVHGFNVWEGNPKCHTSRKSSCSGADWSQGCGYMKFMTAEAAKYGAGKGANWHPSAGFHMLRGEAITWLWALTLLDALYMLEDDSKTTKISSLYGSYSGKLESLQPPMGSPEHCKGLHCQFRNKCYTNFYPHFGKKDSTIDDLIAGETSWDFSGDKPSAAWHGKFGYRDMKPYYTMASKSGGLGEMHLKITTGENNWVWLCGSIGAAQVYVDRDGRKRVGNDNSYTPPKDRTLLTTRRGANNGCTAIESIPSGDNILTIAHNMSAPGATSSLITVLVWPDPGKWKIDETLFAQ